MPWLVNLAVAAGAAILADTVVSEATGKHIHEHVFSWWCEIRDVVSNWLYANKHLQIAGVVGYVTEKIDLGFVFGKRKLDVVFKVVAIDEQDNLHVITEEVLSAEEALKKFPELKKQDFVVLNDYLTA